MKRRRETSFWRSSSGIRGILLMVALCSSLATGETTLSPGQETKLQENNGTFSKMNTTMSTIPDLMTTSELQTLPATNTTDQGNFNTSSGNWNQTDDESSWMESEESDEYSESTENNSTVIKAIKLEFTMTGINFSEDLNNIDSQPYIDLSSEVISNLERVLSASLGSDNFVGVEVIQFSEGSVVAETEVTVSNDNVTSDDVSGSVKNASENGSLGMEVDPNSVKAEEVSMVDENVVPVTFILSLRVTNYEYTSGMADSSSESFGDMATLIENELNAILNDSLGENLLSGYKIESLTAGSVKSSGNISVTNSTNSTTVENSVISASNNSKFSNISVDPNSVSVTENASTTTTSLTETTQATTVTSDSATTSSGNAATSGGTSSSGGTNTSGGTSSSGGTNTSGGTSSSGGTNTSGGTSISGGTNTSSNTSSSGGTNTSGGTSSSGGTNITGGTSSSGSGNINSAGNASNSTSTSGENSANVTVNGTRTVDELATGSVPRISEHVEADIKIIRPNYLLEVTIPVFAIMLLVLLAFLCCTSGNAICCGGKNIDSAVP